MAIKTDINLNKNDEEVLLDRYVEEISVYQPLTDEEEARLSLLIREGNAEAKNKLINANLKFVVSIARQYVADGISILDLINEGNIALIHAAGNFDTIHGQRFSTYAVWEIRKAIEKFLPEKEVRMNRTMSDQIPCNAKDADSSAMENDTELLAELLPSLPEREQTVLRYYFGIGGEQLTMAEIGEKMQLRRERIRQIRNRAIRRLKSNRNR